MSSVLTTSHERTLLLVLSKFVVLRRESFGGLMFDHRDSSVTELGHDTHKLLLLCDGTHTFSQVVDRFHLSVHKQVTELIGVLVRRGVVRELTTVSTA